MAWSFLKSPAINAPDNVKLYKLPLDTYILDNFEAAPPVTFATRSVANSWNLQNLLLLHGTLNISI